MDQSEGGGTPGVGHRAMASPFTISIRISAAQSINQVFKVSADEASVCAAPPDDDLNGGGRKLMNRPMVRRFTMCADSNSAACPRPAAPPKRSWTVQSAGDGGP